MKIVTKYKDSIIRELDFYFYKNEGTTPGWEDLMYLGKLYSKYILGNIKRRTVWNHQLDKFEYWE